MVTSDQWAAGGREDLRVGGGLAYGSKHVSRFLAVGGGLACVSKEPSRSEPITQASADILPLRRPPLNHGLTGAV